MAEEDEILAEIFGNDGGGAQGGADVGKELAEEPAPECGFMKKRNKFKQWQRRYFSLLGCHLMYYKEETAPGQSEPLGMLDLHDSKVEPVPEADFKRPNCFRITHLTRKPYVMETESKEDMWRWIEACRLAMALVAPLRIEDISAEEIFFEATKTSFEDGPIMFFAEDCPPVKMDKLSRTPIGVRFLVSNEYTRLKRLNEYILRINGLLYKFEAYKSINYPLGMSSAVPIYTEHGPAAFMDLDAQSSQGFVMGSPRERPSTSFETSFDFGSSFEAGSVITPYSEEAVFCVRRASTSVPNLVDVYLSRTPKQNILPPDITAFHFHNVKYVADGASTKVLLRLGTTSIGFALQNETIVRRVYKDLTLLPPLSPTTVELSVKGTDEETEELVFNLTVECFAMSLRAELTKKLSEHGA